MSDDLREPMDYCQLYGDCLTCRTSWQSAQGLCTCTCHVPGGEEVHEMYVSTDEELYAAEEALAEQREFVAWARQIP